MAGSCYCLDAFCEGDMAGAANVEVITCTRLQELALTKGDTAGLRYHASIPLRVYTGTVQHKKSGDEFKRLGMLNVAFPGWRRLTLEELGLLYTVGDMLSVAIERARLHATRLKAAQTEERNRLAREIHDTIAQDFSAIAFRLEAAEALLQQQTGFVPDERPVLTKVVHENIAIALELARKGLEEARRSVLDLRAAPLEGRTLAEALAALAAATQAQTKLRLRFEPANPLPTLSPAIEVGLYRVAQEALHNVVRHAKATQVILGLRATATQIVLTIEDNGIGNNGLDCYLEPLAADCRNDPDSDDTRFGLIGMQERARLLGGELYLEPAPKQGLRVVAVIPIHMSPRPAQLDGPPEKPVPE